MSQEDKQEILEFVTIPKDILEIPINEKVSNLILMNLVNQQAFLFAGGMIDIEEKKYDENRQFFSKEQLMTMKESGIIIQIILYYQQIYSQKSKTSQIKNSKLLDGKKMKKIFLRYLKYIKFI